MSMKFLKPLSAILLGRCGNNIWKAHTEDYTTTVVGTIVNENGTDEQLYGIYVTRSQLEQIRNEIDSYLQRTIENEPKLGIADSLQELEGTAVISSFNFNITGDSKLSKEEVGKLLLEIVQQVTETEERQSNDAEQKQRLKINPELVKIEQNTEVLGMPSNLWRASIDDWRNLTDNRAGYIYLYALGDSEEEARARLNEQFEALILRFADTETTGSEASSATSIKNLFNFEGEISSLSPKAKAILEAMTRIQSKQFGKIADTPASQNENTEPQKTKEKSQPFKLNPNRVSSRIDYNATGHAYWEARTTLYFGDTPLEVICSEYMTEELARAALDRKVERLISRLTD